jgi:hypothetical protein
MQNEWTKAADRRIMETEMEKVIEKTGANECS